MKTPRTYNASRVDISHMTAARFHNDADKIRQIAARLRRSDMEDLAKQTDAAADLLANIGVALKVRLRRKESERLT
jgi:hypothetical protein